MNEPVKATGASPPTDSELFGLIIESTTDFAIFTVDEAGATTSWNIGAERLFGYSSRAIVGLSADVLFTPEDRQRDEPQRERSMAVANGRALDERWHVRNDGSRFWASGLLMPLRNGAGFVKIARDLTEKHAAEQRLRENEERFRVLATSIPQLVFRTRSDGHRTWPSPQWIDFTGLGFDASLGVGWLDAIHPDDREATLAAWRDSATSGAYYVEHRVWRRVDGEYRWHQTRARPIESGDPNSDWVGTMTDIHDLRGLQGRQQMLMAELQHRTRNLLAVVQSIASQTLRKSPSLREFGVEFEGRLRAIGRVQSLLGRPGQRDLDLRSLVELELGAYAGEALESGRVELRGPHVALPAASAQAFVLGIHELATNAFKYGALARPNGRLTVNWAVGNHGKGPEVSLEWRETGVPTARDGTPRRRGYGTELIERALPYQLRARTRLEFTDDGVRCLIDVPLRSEHSADV